METHTLSEPALGIGRLYLGAPLRIRQRFLVIAQLQPALSAVCPDGPHRGIQLHGLRVVHGRLHEVVGPEHVVSSLALLLRALSTLLCCWCSLRLRLPGVARSPNGRRLHRVLARVAPDCICHEGVLGPPGVESRAELHRSSQASYVHLAPRTAPADGQARRVLVVDAANMIPLRVAHADRVCALINLKRAEGMRQFDIDVVTLVQLHGRGGDVSLNLETDPTALVQHDLHQARGQHVGNALALAEA
mmetsp:Transcript_92243/g.275156  ORF Transcript_92243/g.275156 Transcript_92243/m.275156 type:complete len:247 (-) Transcript_92243:359-1099(-)